jgi:hypothetical protein
VIDDRGQPVAQARVEFPDAKRVVWAGGDGSFEAEARPGRLRLRVQRFGYEALTTEVVAWSGDAEPTVFVLRPRPLRSSPVVVSASRAAPPASPAPGHYLLEAERAGRQLAGFEDVVRGVQSLPGVSARSDLHGEFAVRGSASSANTILLDGIEIPFPYHILGFNSIFNPGLIESAEFYAGGAPAEFGGATGGVLSLHSRGLGPRSERGAFGLSYLSGQARADVGDARFGAAISLRRSYQSELLRILDVGSAALVPSFYDAFVRLRWRPSTSHLVAFGTLHAGDGMDLPRPELRAADYEFLAPEGSEAAERLRAAAARDHLRLENALAVRTFYWRAVLGTSAYLETTLGDVPQTFDFALTGDNHESVHIESRTTTLRQDLAWRAGGHGLRLGWLASRDDTQRRVSAWAGMLTLRESNSAINLVNLKERYEIDAGRRRDRWAVHAQDELALGDGAALALGLRVEHDGFAGEAWADPRLRLSTRLGPGWSLRATWGRTHSPRDQPLEVQPTSGGERLVAELATETTLGIGADLGPRLRGGATAYHKALERLVYESAPAVYASGGIGKARGLETWLEWSARNRPLRARLTWTWSRVRQRDPVAWRRRADYRATDPGTFWVPVYERPYWYAPPQDEPHRLGLEASAGARHWELGLRYQLASGRPYTAVEWVATDPFDVHYGITGARGSARYPAFQRLDVRLAHARTSGRRRWSVYVDVLNATGAENVFQYRYDSTYQVRYAVKMLPTLPTAGFEISF